MIRDELKKAILKAIKTSYPKNRLIILDDIAIEKPENPEHGDYTTNLAMWLGGILRKSRRENAELIVKNLPENNFIEKAEIAGPGFINFFIKKEFYQQELQRVLEECDKFGDLNLFKGKKVQVEFISANPTGPLTLANGRGGFSGDVLANVFKKAGADQEREYYVNDGGNQVKILGKSLLAAASFLKKEKKEEELYRGEYINDWVSKHKEVCERLKDSPFELGQLASVDFLELIKKSVDKMKIKFDKWFSEKKLLESDEVDAVLDYLSKKGLTYEEDEALWFKTTEFGDDKDRVLRKSDGENTYFANDVAYHWDKFEKRKFDKVVNFWGADHHGYVGRMKSAVSAMGHQENLDIIIMQTVRLIKNKKEFKISKRKGEYVTVDDLLELIGGKDTSDVTRFFFLSHAFSTHMDFDLDLARERTEKNPVFYVKYAYARLSGILRQAKSIVRSPKSKVKLELLEHPAEIDLISSLLDLEWRIESILQDKSYPVHHLTFYAREIAEKFHNFYEQCRVLPVNSKQITDNSEKELTSARLKLVEATKIVLGIVMRDLIGIDTPERM